MKLLADLRSIVPDRRLTASEAYGLAERQASRLLSRSGCTTAPVPDDVIAGLPFVHVAHRPMSFGTAAATKWVKPHWVILVNAHEPAVRRRFSLAHEFKHILDHGRVRTLHRLDTPTDRLDYERLCEYFAACLLMPRPWVKAAWVTESQDVVTLARRFEVSPQAMYTRLVQLGLIDRYLRHSDIDNVYHRSWPLSQPEQAA